MHKTTETKLIPLEVKATPEGVIEGYGSVYGNSDLGDDVVMAGAFDESLASDRRPKMLYQHDPSQVLGVWEEMTSDERGLRLKGRIATRTQLGRDVAELAAMGAIDGLSIGFNVVEDEWEGRTRYIKKADLWEVSVVTFPMNQEARIDATKAASMQKRDFERVLTQDAGLSRTVARALMSGGLEAVKATQDAGEGFDDLREALTERALLNAIK